jgi:hypothetical protein
VTILLGSSISSKSSILSLRFCFNRLRRRYLYLSPAIYPLFKLHQRFVLGCDDAALDIRSIFPQRISLCVRYPPIKMADPHGAARIPSWTMVHRSPFKTITYEALLHLCIMSVMNFQHLPGSTPWSASLELAQSQDNQNAFIWHATRRALLLRPESKYCH